MSDRRKHPPGWYVTESQSLQTPYSCDRMVDTTGSYATEDEAIAAAWCRVDEARHQAIVTDADALTCVIRVCSGKVARMRMISGASVGPASWPTSTQPGSLGFGTAAPSLDDGDYVMTWFVEDGHARILVEPITIHDAGVAALVEGDP